MADNTIRSRQFQRLVQEFQIMLEHYENACRMQRLEGQFVEIVEASIYGMSEKFLKLGMGCPKDWSECPGGVCMPRGRTCP